MPAKPVTIGSRYFERQIDAKKFFKDMLGRYSRGDVVDADDSKDLLSLLSRHIHFLEKVGAGVDYFKVDHDGYGGRCFWIVRTDGTEEDFSYPRCITGIWDK